ncbi:haloacid dehalogenase-like hydrolase [Umezawaea sp. Da 62-37]|uniref:HAD family hydrolase n=1 Tax=Umezawaea sp. Da 62-37 TaxID=3075927 RepID=UPI0028F6E847|nr:haloacid dehalogenase-like hydrolase [Umezawaea sp. Da 62-37]WNV89800.1 haloacid dehalogenase-like hydrolase [Umezawaea sp. Da 62-37]
MKTLVLWDIDQTLMEARGLGHSWYSTALQAATGAEMRHVPSFPGRTEMAISHELLVLHDIEPTDDQIAALHRELVAVAHREHGLLAEHGRALAGAAEALAALAARDDVVQSVVTGNLVEIARYKLAAYGLDPHVDFDIGGYGSLSPDRPALVIEAIRRATTKHGHEFPAESVVVLGDTPHDITAALHHGATAIGVATGRSTVADLEAAGAHTVLADLTDTAAVLAAVLRT